MNILVTIVLWLVLLLHPWRIQTLAPPRPRPARRRHPITRTGQIADGRMLTFDGLRYYHVAGMRFQVEYFYRRLPKAGGDA